MNRIFLSFPITDFYKTKLQVLNWATRFDTFCFLDNHEYDSAEHKYECLVAAGILQSIESSASKALQQLREFGQANNDWLFGHLGFDLKNEIEGVTSSHIDNIQFPDLFFFIPEIIVDVNRHSITIGSYADDHESILREILGSPHVVQYSSKPKIHLQPRFSQIEYISTVERLLEHIHRGDCYEINFCQEFFADEVDLTPVNVFSALSHISPTPFAAFYRMKDKFLMCASPERYLRKLNDTVLAQPIKGTSNRYRHDVKLDDNSKKELMSSQKDRAENVMVVDLVRNDLSKVCKEGTVRVEELYGIYSFPQVHQMISTISGKLGEENDWVDIIAATFPMGSMTGAPKRKVLELIEQYERTKRGLFSGAVGYVSPERNFDFNVVIRSILYNSSSKYLSYQVGSGITFYSDPIKELEECLLKAEAMRQALQS